MVNKQISIYNLIRTNKTMKVSLKRTILLIYEKLSDRKYHTHTQIYESIHLIKEPICYYYIKELSNELHTALCWYEQNNFLQTKFYDNEIKQIREKQYKLKKGVNI